MYLSFQDLKKYQFFYWFAFPAPSHPLVYLPEEAVPLKDTYNDNQIQSLIDSFNHLDVEQKPYFFINVTENGLISLPLSYAIKAGMQNDFCDTIDIKNMCFGFIDCSNDVYPGWTLRNLIALLAYHCKSISGLTIPFVSLRIKQNGNFDDSVVFKVFFPHVRVFNHHNT